MTQVLLLLDSLQGECHGSKVPAQITRSCCHQNPWGRCDLCRIPGHSPPSGLVVTLSSFLCPQAQHAPDDGWAGQARTDPLATSHHAGHCLGACVFLHLEGCWLDWKGRKVCVCIMGAHRRGDSSTGGVSWTRAHLQAPSNFS